MSFTRSAAEFRYAFAYLDVSPEDVQGIRVSVEFPNARAYTTALRSLEREFKDALNPYEHSKVGWIRINGTGCTFRLFGTEHTWTFRAAPTRYEIRGDVVGSFGPND